MRSPAWVAYLPRGLLIALAPFILLHIFLGIADLYRREKPDHGYSMGSDSHSIVSVRPGGPADQAGLKPGDRILAINEVPITRLDQLIRMTARIQVGDVVNYRVSRDGREIETSLVMGELPVQARFQKTTLAATGLAFLAVGILVAWRRADAMAMVFYSLTLVFAFLFAPVPMHPSLAWNLEIKILYDLSYLLLPALFLHFFLIFPYRKKVLANHPRLVPTLYGASLSLFAVGATLDVFFLVGRRHTLLPAIKIFSTLSAFLIMAGLLLGIGSFVTSYMHTPPGNVRRRLKGVLWGTVLGILPVVAGSLVRMIAPTVNLPGARYYHLSLFLVPLSFGYAIVRYGLMDLEIILKRSVVYTILTALLAAIYLLIVDVIGRLTMIRGGEESFLLKLAAIFLMAIVFSPVRSRVQGLVDRTFYRERLNYRDTLRDLTEEITGIIEPDPLVNRLARRVADVLRVKGVAVYLEGKNAGTFGCAAAAGNGMASSACYTFNTHDQVVAWALERRGVLPIERLHESVRWNRLPRVEKQALRELDAALLLPLISGEHLVGLVLVGGKESGDVHAIEELELLRSVATQAAVAVENALLHKEALARARFEEELALARKIQENFLPEAPPDLPEVELSALNVPCQEVGGDYYDFLLLGNRKALGLAIGDASGKGIPAALLMASFQAAFHAEAESQRSPAQVLEKLNRLIIRQSRSERFVTFFYGLVDVESRVLTYANAGHNPPLLLHPDGTGLTLDQSGLLLGVSPETQYQNAQLPLAEGDILLLYTDGVTDELSPGDEIFGVERLETILRTSRDAPLAEILGAIYHSVSDFMGGRPEDDITLLAMKVR